ncbi:MAG TPA: hypothetical protein VEQ58_06060, partial [Polyangiaceae bacterium]|nr:hypothetical protein [Polyangiaceae bacterium]
MKAVLGLTAITLFSVSCSADGDALFEDIAGQSTGAAAGNGATSGSANGGKGGGSGESGTSQGGNVESGGVSGRGGSAGSAGSDSGGRGGGGDGPGGSDGGGGGDGESGASGDGGDGGGGTIVDPEVIYVATNGTDSDDCGLERSAPCQTISRGVSRSVAAARDTVYVQAGSYPGVVVLASGVRVLGGFDASWTSGAYTEPEHRVVIEGGSEATSQEYLAVWAHNLAALATLENLVLTPPHAEGQRTGGLDGRSSYGVHAVSAKLLLKDVAINAGDGAPGADGENGLDAENTSVVDSMNGKVGTDGVTGSMGAACNITTST